MKKILVNRTLIFLIRILLGGIFIISSLDKINDPSAFTVSILNYRIVESGFATLVATVLPPLELLCGLSLILGIYPRAGTILITIMLLVFTIIVAIAIIRGLDISCGCFSQDPNADKIGYKKILENSGMLILSIFLIFAKDYGFSLFHLITKKTVSG